MVTVCEASAVDLRNVYLSESKTQESGQDRLFLGEVKGALFKIRRAG
jgi:hypothetical protein